MKFQVGDMVTRISYGHDIVFVIDRIEGDTYYLIGKSIRLCADALEDDLERIEKEEEDHEFLERIKPIALDRNDYFYLPGKILHIDGDRNYLEKSLNYYKEANIWAVGLHEKECDIAGKIGTYLKEYNPNIVVITGHDAYLKKRGSRDELINYKNSIFYVNAIQEARKYEKSHEKLIIIAGGCQSSYEDLIKAGANFASSPKRINIHALDPAIIAVKMSMSDINKDIQIKEILECTKYGADGMGGIITKGTMYVGYPR